MKTSREIEMEIEKKFGKDVMTKEQELKKLEHELEQARDLENKIDKKETELPLGLIKSDAEDILETVNTEIMRLKE